MYVQYTDNGLDQAMKALYSKVENLLILNDTDVSLNSTEFEFIFQVSV
jgi:hypothetical protein